MAVFRWRGQELLYTSSRCPVVKIIGDLAESGVVFCRRGRRPCCEAINCVGNVGACAKYIDEHSEEGCILTFVGSWGCVLVVVIEAG